MQIHVSRISRWMKASFVFGAVVALLSFSTLTLAEPFPTATPESQGVSASAIDELNKVLQGYLDQDMFVGAEFVIIKNRQLIYQQAFGLRDKQENLPYTANTICNLRSMTKPLTGAAAQILMDRGLLALDDTVSMYIPSFDTDANRDITVEQLLTHRAGLALTAFSGSIESINQFADLQALAGAVGKMELQHEPDSKFWYSDAGTDTLGAVVEQVAGMPLDEFVTKEILQPLGMDDTFYALDGDDPRFPRIASLYGGGANVWSRFWTPNDGPFYPFAWGSQTLFGTPVDYAKFLAMWMDDGKAADGERILSSAAVKRTLTPASPMSMLGSDVAFPTEFSDLVVHYGQMSVLHMPTADPANAKPTIIGHSGSDGTIAWAWPDEDLMILFYTQSRGGTSLLRIEPTIDQLIIHPDREVVVEEVPEQYAPYVGTYLANFGSFENSEFVVQMHKGKLALDIPTQMLFDLLEPDEEGKWKFALVPDQVAISFERDSDGVVHLLKLYQGPVEIDIPRKGSKLAAERVSVPADNPAAAAKLLATFHDAENDRDLTTFLDGDALCMQIPGRVVHLRATADPLRWEIKEAGGVILAFALNEEGTQPITLTRIIGDNQVTWPRVEEVEPEGDQDVDDGDGG